MSAPRSAGSPVDRTERIVLWLVLLLGAILMFLAAGSARGDETVNRTDRISATLPSGCTLRVDNISGDVVAAPGSEFKAVAIVVVVAPDRHRAAELLDRVRIVQEREGNDLSIRTRWPDSRWRFDKSEGRAMRGLSARCDDCRINARYELTIPPGVRAVLSTVNGDVRVRDLDGDLRLRTVNGKVEATGVRRSLDAESVNGDVIGLATSMPKGTSYELDTVNGAVRLTLPKDAAFDFSASTMHGSIASTFALPKGDDSTEEFVRRRVREEVIEGRPVRKIIVRREEGNDEPLVVDLKELEKELEQSMKTVDVEIRESMRSSEDAVREGVAGGVRGGVREGVRGGIFQFIDPHRSYSGTVRGGGARVRLSALNGSILLLAGGTRPEDAKPVVSERRSFVVTVPRIQVRVPEVKVDVPAVKVRVPEIRVDVPETRVVVPAPVVEAHPAPRVVWAIGAPVERGDVAGDFLSTSGTSSYRIGNVSGRVKILTHSGEISVASAGADADVKTLGGDIRIGPVNGDLAAQTLAGDVRAAAIAGSARVETSGGDIRIERVGGGLEARTAGGDIVVPLVGGHVDAETAGGDVRIAVAVREPRDGISIVNGGGDVALVLPADFKGSLDLTVEDADLSEPAVRSDFPEISITRKDGSVRATGVINGGGEKVRVKTSSGTIRVRKGPAAQK
jgi:DUF4097 and DUF4098 domain-containing protein YvlB